MVLAQEEARLLEDSVIGTEHLLLGLLHEGEGVAAKVLKRYFTSVEDLREALRDGSSRTPAGHIPFTKESKQALEASLSESLQLGHNYIGTEHILLGLCRTEDCVAHSILEGAAGISQIRLDVIKELAGFQSHPPQPPKPRTPNVIGDVVGVDFTKRDDGKIILHVAVPEDYYVRRQSVVLLPNED